MKDVDSKYKFKECKATIFNDVKIMTKYSHAGQDEGISLEDCFLEFYKDGETGGTLTVIFDSYLSGVIYQYGNYGAFWVEHGKTKGMA